MSRKNYKLFTKRNFNNLLSYGWESLKRIVMTFAFFGSMTILPTMLIAWGLDFWGIIIPKIIKQILITILPIFGALFTSLCKEEDYYDEFSMDLVFATWLAVIIWVWKFF